MINTKREWYITGEWSARRCSMIGHNLDCVRVTWKGKIGKQMWGTATCLNCGATARVMQYAKYAR